VLRATFVPIRREGRHETEATKGDENVEHKGSMVVHDDGVPVEITIFDPRSDSGGGCWQYRVLSPYSRRSQLRTELKEYRRFETRAGARLPVRFLDFGDGVNTTVRPNWVTGKSIRKEVYKAFFESIRAAPAKGKVRAFAPWPRLDQNKRKGPLVSQDGRHPSGMRAC
jgi:hypothetical protein